ncbi:18362_t:CDS:2, partial [Acaulospora morrowiae]
QGHGAYLLKGQLADVLQCTVGNIASGQTVMIKTTYVTELKHDTDSEQIRFILPTAIAPRYGSPHDNRVLFTSHSTAVNLDGDSKVARVTLSDVTYLEKDFILIGDNEWRAIQKAIQTLQLLVRSLPEGCYFNVILFGSDYDSLFPQSQLYSEVTLTQALDHAKAMSANYGGTEIHDPLKWSFDSSIFNMQTSVFLFTDGTSRH